MDSNIKIEALIDNIERVLIGKRECVKLVIVGLIARGHVLIEDVPGVGKTTLARALAKSIDCSFQRIQFTPDLLPGDIIGISIFQQQSGQLLFKPGPIFASVILADEINRATPRTQSSLLEAMNDFQVSVDGTTHNLPNPFIVLATQNPTEFEGTYPLPESQLDRFLMRVKIGYPDLEQEMKILSSHSSSSPLDDLTPVLDAEDILGLQKAAEKVHIDKSLMEYILKIAAKTRESKFLELGISPRGCLNLFRASKALALVEKRNFCIPDDIKKLTLPVLLHRLITKNGRNLGVTQDAQEILLDILEELPIPE
ncbi:MAG: AAA family ATPase [Candidatus Schekmanbacteria bacterium]|nr:AAA family ATPase [Candidatus Schekmanbacteria bacterium]